LIVAGSWAYHNNVMEELEVHKKILVACLSVALLLFAAMGLSFPVLWGSNSVFAQLVFLFVDLCCSIA